MPETELTAKEERAIAELERLAKRWPRSLWLFGASGTLEVRKETHDGGHGRQAVVATIRGILADGGDGGDIF